MVATTTVLSDTVKFIRDDLSTNITDPISAARTGRERFVMTSYPQRGVRYPIITVKHLGASDIRRLGMQSELHLVRIPIEVRIWARNMKEKDNLTEQVYNRLRSNQFDGGSASTDAGLHDFKVKSNVAIDEPGEGGIKSQVIQVEYVFVLGS